MYYNAVKINNINQTSMPKRGFMSDYILKIIPASPLFVPCSISQINAYRHLKSIYINNDIKLTTNDEVEFIDCGENFHEVICPYCKQSLNMEWWGEKMGAIYESHFNEASFELPCCSNNTHIFDLLYKENCGFSKFVTEVINPDIDLTPVQISELERIISCNLKVIKAYY